MEWLDGDGTFAAVLIGMLNPPLIRLALVVPVVTAAACLEAPLLSSTGDITLDLDLEGPLRGVSRDPLDGRLHLLVEAQGILTIDEEGTLVGEIPVETKGLRDLPYRDLASLGDDRFLLIADNEGYQFDALTEMLRVHFCVEPGFAECFDENGALIDANGNGVCDWDEQQPKPEPGEPPIVQRNDALALVGTEVVAAPRFYEQGQRVEASLRSYNANTGAATGAVDLSGIEIDLSGLTAHGARLVGVGGNQLVTFGNDGQLLTAARLDGVTDAVGAVSDGDDIVILDAATSRLVRFTLTD